MEVTYLGGQVPSRVGEKHRKANEAKLALGGRYLLHWLFERFHYCHSVA
uniref:Uncharacterized protein n=1 Tax=Anguilla anguilla TaxID=7936 RepID=A0A0E9SAC3_ANGAN